MLAGLAQGSYLNDKQLARLPPHFFLPALLAEAISWNGTPVILHYGEPKRAT